MTKQPRGALPPIPLTVLTGFPSDPLHRAKKLMREQLQTKLGSALNDTFPFQDPRCAEFTDALLARFAQSGDARQLRQRSFSKD